MSQPLPARGVFTPRFILPEETVLYGLPDASRTPAILSLIDGASALIDVHTGRVDGYGNGSLVYSTYLERLLMQARGRNVVRLSFKPLAVVDASTINDLQASANSIPTNIQTSKKLQSGASSNPLLFTNYWWTGCKPNLVGTTNVPGSTMSPLIGCSGRYGATIRRSDYMVAPDLNYGVNPLQFASFFGGPSFWTSIAIDLTDFDPTTGEIWVPAGLYLSQYTEIVCEYNAGFHPLYIPRPIKQACAMLVRNLLSRGGGVTGLRSLTATGTANVSFTPDLIDTTIEGILSPFVNVIAY
jgi:hypothetical protein